MNLSSVVLAVVGWRKGDRIVVGLARETDHVAENARAKRESKQADLIVANDVTAEGSGLDHDTNIVTLYSRHGGEKALPRMPKIDAAHRILDRMLELRREGREISATRRAR